MTELTDEMKQYVHATCAIVLCEVLHDEPIWEVIRIVCSARWGSLARTLRERRAATAAGTVR